MYHLSIRAARADAVFASALQRSAEPNAGQVRRAVAETIRAFGSRGCAARVAQEFGDHPETAAARMRWARIVASQAFGTRRAPVRCEAPGAAEVLDTAEAIGTTQVLGTAGVSGTTGVLSRADALHAREAQPGRARSLARYPVATGGRAA
jgi:hypothetical protein